MEDINVVRAGIPALYGCPVLTRVKAFIVPQGGYSMLEHQFYDQRTGAAIDISPIVGGAEPGDSISVPTGKGYVKMRAKEPIATSINPVTDPFWEIQCGEIDPVNGIVRTTGLPEKLVEHAGVYELSFGVFDYKNRLILMNKGLLSVERSLFPKSMHVALGVAQPLTIQEMRGFLWDSSPAENLLLRDVEFGDEQILEALCKPIRYWNETPPPIRKFNTRTFPFRHHWEKGTSSELYRMAAAHYRRNKQNINAGGMAVDDLNREREYLAEAVRLWKEYADWVLTQKIAMNVRMVTGSVGSVYRGTWWD